MRNNFVLNEKEKKKRRRRGKKEGKKVSRFATKQTDCKPGARAVAWKNRTDSYGHRGDSILKLFHFREAICKQSPTVSWGTEI